VYEMRTQLIFNYWQNDKRDNINESTQNENPGFPKSTAESYMCIKDG